MAEKEKVKERTVVVSELPTQQYNTVEENGEKINLVSFTDALTEIYNDVKEIKKAVS